jgi:serine/threonine protein kinase
MTYSDKKNIHSNHLNSIEDYGFQRTLGKGSMGKVKLAVHNETGEKVLIFLFFNEINKI